MVENPAKIDQFIAALVLNHGKRYMPATLPADLKHMKLGECFDNALLQAVEHKGDYGYVEGIGFCWGVDGSMVGMLHAWLTDGYSAYDPTWKAEMPDGTPCLLPAFYLGVELDIRACAEFVNATENQGVLVNRQLNHKLFNKVLKASNL